jgi:hypothetical protein
MFDRFGNTQRVRALVDTAAKLELEEPAPQDKSAFNPYERTTIPKAKPRTDQPAGGDPYSSGPARRPEDMSFNPYASPPRTRTR